jgi:hypothetical protein
MVLPVGWPTALFFGFLAGFTRSLISSLLHLPLLHLPLPEREV